MSFINQLKIELEAQADSNNALQMQAYMKDLFPFFGVKAPIRKNLLKKVLISNKNEVADNCRDIVSELYEYSSREYQYCAIEIASKFLKNKYLESDFEFIKNLITNKPHWDTVDFIAKHILGNYLLQFWDNRHSYVDILSNSDHMWLNRSVILFQLGYKSKTDATILYRECKAHADSNAFFIQKAIEWALRAYDKTNPQSVIDFVSNTDLKPLSKREALKRLQI